MINVIVPIVEDAENFSEFVKRIDGRGVKIFVGVRKGLEFDYKRAEEELVEEKKSSRGKKKTQKETTEKSKKTDSNVEIHYFAENANAEEIINALHSCKMKKGRILICRRPLTDVEFSKLTNSQKEIATLKARHSKFFAFLKNLGKAIVKRFFAFSFFEDISAICYSESMFELMSVYTNLSMASRINRYVGVEVEEIETAEKPVKKLYSRWKTILLFLMWSLIFAGSVAGGVLICVLTHPHALIVILVIFWILLAAFLWFVGFVNFTRTLAVGNLRYGKAEESK